MARITKKIKPYIVIVDSNILFSPDKKIAVNPAFDAFWEKYAKDCNLRLHIPQIVLGELQFQHLKKVTTSYKNVIHEIEEIAEIAHRKYTHTITEASLKQRINDKFKKWLSSKGAKILHVPIGKINWEKIIDMAIWREPPFSYEEHREKGFRDSLIMETIDVFSKAISGDLNIAFICNDELLCEGVKHRLKNNPSLNIYRTLTDFENYLKLEKRKFRKEFIVEVLKNASSKFFQVNNQDSIYYKEKIKDKILPEIQKYINNPEIASTSKPPSLLAGLLANSQEAQTWEPIDSGTYWISNPDIAKTDKDNYLWETDINYVRQYRNKGTTLLTYEEKLLVLTFKISWEAQVSKDARFWGIKVGNIGLTKTSFENATEEQIKQWHLKPDQGQPEKT